MSFSRVCWRKSRPCVVLICHSRSSKSIARLKYCCIPSGLLVSGISSVLWPRFHGEGKAQFRLIVWRPGDRYFCSGVTIFNNKNMPGRTVPVNSKLAAAADVEIDDSGQFKYILCKVYEGAKKDEFKYIVRGHLGSEFHSDIYDSIDAQLESFGITCECVGGGKIQHDSENKTILVRGQSQGYGKANHSTTVDILRRHFPEYTSITMSDD